MDTPTTGGFDGPHAPRSFRRTKRIQFVCRGCCAYIAEIRLEGTYVRKTGLRVMETERGKGLRPAPLFLASGE